MQKNSHQQEIAIILSLLFLYIFDFIGLLSLYLFFHISYLQIFTFIHIFTFHKMRVLAFRFLILVLSLVFCLNILHAQTQRDSLHHLIDSSLGSKRVDIYNQLAKLSLGEKDSVLYYFKKAQQLSKEISYPKGHADAYFHNGIMNQIIGNYLESNKLFHQALDIYTKIEDASSISKCLNNIGRNYLKKNDLVKALIVYKQVAEYNDSIQIANSYTNIGETMIYGGSFPKALDYFYRSNSICKTYNHQSGIANNYLGIAIVYSYQNDLVKSIEYFTKAKEIFGSMNDEFGVANCTNNIGVALQRLGKTDEAIKAYKESLIISKSLNLKASNIRTNINLGEAYWELGDFSQSKGKL